MKKKRSTQVNVKEIISRPPKVDTKMLTKKEVTEEPHNLGELKRTPIRVLKRRDLKTFATIAERRATCLKIVVQGKIMLKVML